MGLFRLPKFGLVWCLSFCMMMIAFESAKSVIIEEVSNPELPVAVSSGAMIEKLSDVILYTRMEYIYFTVPDLIDPPSITQSPVCGKSKDDYSCNLFAGMQSSLKDVNDLLTVINRVLTSKGLKSANARNVTQVAIPSAWVSPPQEVDEQSVGPTPDMIASVGREWFSETETQLALRKLLQSPITELNDREKRVANWLKPVVSALKVVGSGQIKKIFDHLFVGDNGIMSFLTSEKILSKEEYTHLADLPRQVSELQTETRKLLYDVLNSTETVKELAERFQTYSKGQDIKFATIEDSFIQEQVTLADIIRSLYTSIAYTISFASFEECRSSHLPTAVVPPTLLKQRLIEVESFLPESVKLAIPLSEYQRYYKLSFAECIFDSDGGLIKLAVPVIEKGSAVSLHSFKPMQFAHGDQTCSIEMNSKLVIKDSATNRVVSVDELSEVYCRPEEGHCMVPRLSPDDSNQLCTRALLSGQPASVIKDACTLKCVSYNQPSVTQVSDGTFVGIHIPKDVARMECPNGQVQLATDVPEGSVRFKGGCDCHVFIRNELIGSTTPDICDPSVKPQLDILLPIQMTSFSGLLPLADDGEDKATFSTVSEIYNPSFDAVPTSVIDQFEISLTALSIVTNLLQSMFIAYLKVRVSSTAASLASLTSEFRAVRAFSQHPCVLPTNAYALLVSILVLAVIAVVPPILKMIWDQIKGYHDDMVDDEANRIALARQIGHR